MTKAIVLTPYPFGSAMPTRGWSDANRQYRYGFNGKEKDFETSSDNYDFGARILDTRLGRWLSLDPLMKKYSNLSPYDFAANSSILFHDPNGKEIVVTTVYNLDGTKTVSIVITAKIINNSSENYSYEQMMGYAERSAKSLIEVYSINEPGVNVNVSVDISVATSEDQISSTDHVIRLVDDGCMPGILRKGGTAIIPKGGAVGSTPMGQNVIYITTNILDKQPAEDGSYAGSGRAEGVDPATGESYPQATLERTIAHEFGHSAGILNSNIGGEEHPKEGTMPENIMHQTRQNNAGMKVTGAQINEIQNNYNSGEINKGQQEIIIR